jgi:hypothetical protein
MSKACEQCAAFERQLSEIKDEIAAEIRKGHRHRAEAKSDQNRWSLATLIALLSQTEEIYRSHKEVFHRGAD